MQGACQSSGMLLFCSRHKWYDSCLCKLRAICLAHFMHPANLMPFIWHLFGMFVASCKVRATKIKCRIFFEKSCADAAQNSPQLSTQAIKAAAADFVCNINKLQQQTKSAKALRLQGFKAVWRQTWGAKTDRRRPFGQNCQPNHPQACPAPNGSSPWP